jgi:catechol 2,3-dioxygenase-like lactoylglutathione lyase family enzyme
MNQTGTTMKQPQSDANVTKVAMSLEVCVTPVSSVERSKEFYQRLGWRLDEDVAPAKDVRIVQFTPPGSGCSVTFGKGITAAAPGSAVGTLTSYGSFFAFNDPDGNAWLVQEVTTRHPGRI